MDVIISPFQFGTQFKNINPSRRESSLDKKKRNGI